MAPQTCIFASKVAQLLAVVEASGFELVQKDGKVSGRKARRGRARPKRRKRKVGNTQVAREAQRPARSVLPRARASTRPLQ
jgi:hypothetical protein